MPSVYDFKPRFQSLLRPIVGRVARTRVTANQVTVAAVILSAIGGGLVAIYPDQWWALALMPVVLLVRMGLNAVDGMLAREFGQQSRLGAVLNELGDVLSDVFLYLPLALHPMIQPWAIVAFVLSSVVSEFTGVVAIQVGGERRYDGPMGKSDRAFWIGLLATLLALGVLTETWATLYASTLAILSVPTVINRARRALSSQGEQTHAQNETETLPQRSPSCRPQHSNAKTP